MLIQFEGCKLAKMQLKIDLVCTQNFIKKLQYFQGCITEKQGNFNARGKSHFWLGPVTSRFVAGAYVTCAFTSGKVKRMNQKPHS